MGKPTIRFEEYTDDWEQRKFGDLADYKKGPFGSAITKDMFVPKSEESIKVYEQQNAINKDWELERYFLPKEYALTKLKSFEVHGGDIIVSCAGTIGEIYEIPENADTGVINQALMRVRVDEDCVDKRMFKIAFSNMIDDFTRVHSNGSAIKNIPPFSDLKPMGVLLPSLQEQEKISSYFEKLDNLITLHHRKCEETKKLKKFMLQKMFPKKGEKVPDIRFDGFTDDWEQRKLGEIITEYKETVDSECTLPILTSSKTEGVILQEEHFGRKQQHDITGYNILPRNYCTYRNRSDGVDFTFNINKCCDKGIISKFYPVFSGKNSDVFFLSLVLNNSDEVVREIAYTCTGTGQKVLSFLDLQKMKVRVPSYDEQKEIAAYFENLDHLITLHQHKCEELQNIKKFMLQNMFT